jgi:RNA polymerase sigma factor (sigma-70 family)
MVGHGAWVRSIIAAYEAKLLRYAGDIVGPSLARDVVQDTFLKLCREPRERVESHVSAWLFTVCRHGALEIKRKVRRLSSLDDQVEEAGEASPGAALEHSELLTQVQRCLEGLPEKQRELVRLKYDGELSYKEIAEITGLSVSNVGFLLSTALAQLRESLAREDPPSASRALRGKR